MTIRKDTERVEINYENTYELFHEVYGLYYRIMEDILTVSLNQNHLSPKDVRKIVDEKGTEETNIFITSTNFGKDWFLTDSSGKTHLKGDVEQSRQNESLSVLDVRHNFKVLAKMPLTTLQKRWLRMLLDDPKIHLFVNDDVMDDLWNGLEDVEPLYPQDAIVYFDRYEDGDPYEDEKYIENFRIILDAVRQNQQGGRVKLRFEYTPPEMETVIKEGIPERLEYSVKDDKFRLYTDGPVSSGITKPDTLNLARIQRCERIEDYTDEEKLNYKREQREVVLELYDGTLHNALQRISFHFSDLEKVTSKLENGTYRIRLAYDEEDEKEMVIRILSYGPRVKVVEPEYFIDLMRERLNRQHRFDD